MHTMFFHHNMASYFQNTTDALQLTCQIIKDSRQCHIQNKNVHLSFLNGALWDMEKVHCRVCENGLFLSSTYIHVFETLAMKWSALVLPVTLSSTFVSQWEAESAMLETAVMQWSKGWEGCPMHWEKPMSVNFLAHGWCNCYFKLVIFSHQG